MSFGKNDLDVQEIARQLAAEIGQQQSKQIAQEVQQAIQALKQAVQGSQQEKSSFSENKAEEILGGEAIRSGVISNTRLWNYNDKALVEKSHDFDLAKKALDLERERIQLVQERATAAKSAAFQHTESVLSLINAYAHVQSVADQAKFNAAVTEPVAPNTQDSGADE